MDDYTSSVVSVTRTEEDMDLRRGPWTMEEDIMLANYIAKHGEGRWNSLARCAGLRRSGKSCRLRWLNYLRPDIRRGNITLEEQLLILELHSSWGNRWSKIAQYLPGRTDNEIKNFWRTRVQKQAKQLRCDVNSTQFKDAMRYLSMPILLERIQATSAAKSAIDIVIPSSPVVDTAQVTTSFTPEHSINSMMTQRQVSSGSDLTADFEFDYSHSAPNCESPHASIRRPESLSPSFFDESLEFSITEPDAWSGGDTFGNTWNIEDIWHLEQLCRDI